MSALHIERYLGQSGAGFSDLYTVPAGKLLEVKYLYLTVTYPASQVIPFFSLYATAGGTEAGVACSASHFPLNHALCEHETNGFRLRSCPNPPVHAVAAVAALLHDAMTP
jgi:hypothetical protein